MIVPMSTAVAALTPLAMPSFSIIYGTGVVSRKEMIRTGFIVASVCGPVLATIIFVLNLLS